MHNNLRRKKLFLRILHDEGGIFNESTYVRVELHYIRKKCTIGTSLLRKLVCVLIRLVNV